MGVASSSGPASASGSGSGASNYIQMTPNSSSRSSAGGRNSGADTNSERMRELESVMSRSRAVRTGDVTGDGRRPSSKSGAPENGATDATRARRFGGDRDDSSSQKVRATGLARSRVIDEDLL